MEYGVLNVIIKPVDNRYILYIFFYRYIFGLYTYKENENEHSSFGIFYGIKGVYREGDWVKYLPFSKVEYRGLNEGLMKYLFEKLKIKNLLEVEYRSFLLGSTLSYYVINLEDLNKYKEQ